MRRHSSNNINGQKEEVCDVFLLRFDLMKRKRKHAVSIDLRVGHVKVLNFML